MSRTNEAKNIKWHETCKCECRLDAIVCNDKQRWSKDKCRCECKEFIHKGVYVYVYYEKKLYIVFGKTMGMCESIGILN